MAISQWTLCSHYWRATFLKPTITAGSTGLVPVNIGPMVSGCVLWSSVGSNQLSQSYSMAIPMPARMALLNLTAFGMHVILTSIYKVNSGISINKIFF
jgi:hypothetical protein